MRASRRFGKSAENRRATADDDEREPLKKGTIIELLTLRIRAANRHAYRRAVNMPEALCLVVSGSNGRATLLSRYRFDVRNACVIKAKRGVEIGFSIFL